VDFADALRHFRAQAGLTQEELAAAAQVGVNTVADLEQRRHRRTQKLTAERLADALGMPAPMRDAFIAAARGRASAAGLPAAPTPVSNLPAQLTTFIGRERELAEIRSLVRSRRLVTLTGAGGCGKTRLSLRLAADLLAESGDGAWLVELAAVCDQEAVAPAIAAVLGIAGQPGRPGLEVLLDALAPQQALIVLDNCEHLIGGCAKTAEAILLRCPRVRLVATSREPLGIGGEIMYQVPPMSLPGAGDLSGAAARSCDAVALFADRAHAQGAGVVVDDQTAPLVVSICRKLDGLPLAIELAAARARSLSLAGLHDRLDQRFRLLTGGSRTAPARQQTLAATVNWSYALLDGAEQLLLRRLAVFAETFDLDAVEAVCGFGGIEPSDIPGLLGSLVDKSLVLTEPAGPALRYRLLETIRQFAADRLAEAAGAETTAVAAAHGRYFLSVAEAAAPHLTGSGQAMSLARLEADQANLRKAVSHAAADPGGTEHVLRFGVALHRYWVMRSPLEEDFALIRPVLERPEARDDPELFAAALVAAAGSAILVDIAAARRLGEQAHETARQLGDERLLIQALMVRSEICCWAGEPERGLGLGREAVGLARRLGDDVLLGASLVTCLLHAALIDSAQVTSLFIEAIGCTRRAGDRWIAGLLLNNACDHALLAGDAPAARAYLRQAQALQEEGDEPPHLAINWGWVLRQDEDPHGARSSFQTALRAGRRRGDAIDLAAACLGLACLAADAGDWDQAATLHGVAQAFQDRAGLPWQQLDERYRQDSLNHVRAHLGQDEFERPHAQGMALSPDEALGLAASLANRPSPVSPISAVD
jgi:predicted ATPase/DNA-binding XRE family transcriptional regulator